MTRRTTAIRNAKILLSHEYHVSLTHNNSRLVIHDYEYPWGWHPQTAPLMLRFPDHYPRIQPAVYLPLDIKYRGPNGTPAHFQETHLEREGWRRWCAHYFPWHEEVYQVYQPDTVDFLCYIRASLKRPAEADPIRHASVQYSE